MLVNQCATLKDVRDGDRVLLAPTKKTSNDYDSRFEKTYYRVLDNIGNRNMDTKHTVIGVYDNGQVRFSPEKASENFEVTINIPRDKQYWVMKNYNNSEIKGYMKKTVDTTNFSKTSLRTFAESLAESLEEVMDKIQEISTILNGTSVDEPIVDDSSTETESTTDDTDASDYVDEPTATDTSTETETESTTEPEVGTEIETSGDENFSERYSQIKNFLSGNM